MYKAEGVGLAGPQVGILRRVAVVDIAEDHSGLLELINPEIVETDGSQTERSRTPGRCDPADESARTVPEPERPVDGNENGGL